MKRGCSLGDLACGVQRSVELPVGVIKSRSVPADVCRHAVCWSNLCLSNLSRHRATTRDRSRDSIQYTQALGITIITDSVNNITFYLLA